MNPPPALRTAHDWRGLLPDDRPRYPRGAPALRATGGLLLASLLLGALALHTQTHQAHQAARRARSEQQAADERTRLAEAHLEAAAARQRRSERLLAWLSAHPPLQPLLVSLLAPLAQDTVAVSELLLQADPGEAAAGLRLKFRAPPALARDLLASLPEAAAQAGWRIVPTRQEQDPVSGESLLHAALAPLSP